MQTRWTLAKQIIKKAECYVCIRSYLRLIAFLAVLSQGRKPLDMVIEVNPNEESNAGESDSTESYNEDQMQATGNQ